MERDDQQDCCYQTSGPDVSLSLFAASAETRGTGFCTDITVASYHTDTLTVLSFYERKLQ